MSSSFATTGTLGGTGTMNITDGTLSNQGTISPGLSIGTLTIDGNVDNFDSSNLLIEVAGSGPGQFDLLLVDGTFDVDGSLTVRFLDGAEFLLPTDELTVVDATTLTPLPNANFDQILVQGAGTFDVLTDEDTGLVRLTNFRDIVSIPEPASVALFGAAGLLLMPRRR